jgi:hypothetical protein
MDNHNRTKADQDDSGRLVEALLALLRAIASYADVPQPAGEDWTAYNAVCRSRLLSIRNLAQIITKQMPPHVLLAETKTLHAAAAVLPYRPDLDAARKVVEPAAETENQ